MKLNCVFLVLGVVLIMVLCSDAQSDAVAQPKDCCFNFITGKIPPQIILEVKKTDSLCPQQGFVVTTHKFPSLCVREVEVTG
ncbi:regakine-1-like [Ictalurus furcatus]|uniref:regakine-1-like n=1 Tax=Ictalurus furcatus TaxID=66913 RepID=UPI00234FBD4E|nr:regakine-1-like [Ictalurus furcatus]